MNEAELSEAKLKELYAKLLKVLDINNHHPIGDYQRGYKDALEQIKRTLFE